MMRTSVRGWVCTTCLIAAMIAAGCATAYKKTADGMVDPYRRGDFQTAAVRVNATAAKAQKKPDAVLWKLEQGAVLRAAGDYPLSTMAFDAAEAKADREAQKGGQSAASEVVAFATNQQSLHYLGYDYDKIMLNVYKSLNYLQSGDLDAARVELNRALQRQRDAVAANQKRIEKAAQQARDKGHDVERVQNDERFKGQMEAQYPDLEEFKVYANYVNPFAEFLQGLFFLGAGEDASDAERAALAFRRSLGMVPANDYLRADAELAEAIAAGDASLPELTYVVFETGVAPLREQIRIDIPTFQANMPYTGAAFPKLRFDDNYAPELRVVGPQGTLVAQKVCDMDGVIYAEFQNRMPEVIAKTLVSAGMKAGASYGINSSLQRQGGIGSAVGLLATTAYTAATNEADLRTWRTLPKQFHYLRLPTPADRRVMISIPSAGVSQSVDLQPGRVNVVYVKSTSAGGSPSISQFVLRGP